MAQYYLGVGDYVGLARNQLQDLVGPPNRYSDADVVSALNIALGEMGRLRPDIFLDLKYQMPLRKGDIDEGMPSPYVEADIVSNTLVPVPIKYRTPLQWFIAGWLQFYDVNDTQDVRAQAFITKFQQQLTTLSAA